MAWTVHKWFPGNARGEIRSPHFDPIPFGPVENTTGTSDYEVGEAVFVELDEGPAGYVMVVEPLQTEWFSEGQSRDGEAGSVVRRAEFGATGWEAPSSFHGSGALGRLRVAGRRPLAAMRVWHGLSMHLGQTFI